MYTIDASVWVNSFDQREAGHEASRQFLDYLRRESIPITVPSLACIEVAGALSRTRNAPNEAQAFAVALSRLPNVTIVPLDSTLMQLAIGLAADSRLRGADAVYAAVAVSSGCALVSLDNEHLTRLADIASVLTPREALAAIASASEPAEGESLEGEPPGSEVSASDSEEPPVEEPESAEAPPESPEES